MNRTSECSRVWTHNHMNIRQMQKPFPQRLVAAQTVSNLSIISTEMCLKKTFMLRELHKLRLLRRDLRSSLSLQVEITLYILAHYRIKTLLCKNRTTFWTITDSSRRRTLRSPSCQNGSRCDRIMPIKPITLSKFYAMRPSAGRRSIITCSMTMKHSGSG